MTRRIASPASPRVSSKTPRPGRQPPRVELLSEVAAARCVETERANPTCQRAPGLHGDVRAPGAPGSRGRRASRRTARFSPLTLGRCRRYRPKPVRSGGLWRSGSSRIDGSCDGRRCTDPLALLRTGTRVNGPGGPQSSERLRSTEAPQRPQAHRPVHPPRRRSPAGELPPARARSEVRLSGRNRRGTCVIAASSGRLLPIDVRPEHARERPDFPAHPERSRAGAVGHEGHGR